MRLVTVVGCRPEILRLSAWEEEVIFTGQHFDKNMGQDFLNDLEHCPEIYYLDKEPGLQKKIKELKPDCVIVHGDTRSALEGARATKNLGIKLAHTEAGVRAKDITIEQVIRKEIDHLADFNFCPVPNAVDFLKAEGITEGVYYVGDTLYDHYLKHRKSAGFVFCTIHRHENIENGFRLKSLIDSLEEYEEVVFPVHPHTQKCLDRFNMLLPPNVTVLEPLTYEKTIGFIRDAQLVLTDSGGVQREAFWAGTPCKVLRPSSEWSYYTGMFGDGHAGDKIYKILEEEL